MKFIVLAIVMVLSGSPICEAQARPREDCAFADAGFAVTAGQRVEIAEVARRGAVQLEACGSPRGCVEAPAALETPVQIYREQHGWICGYVSGRGGAGPAWIRSDALRVVPYDEHPPLTAWAGEWIGGEDRVEIRRGSERGTLYLTGSAQWRGRSTAHSGDMKGSASPAGNHLHFVEDGPGSCTIDMTLLGRYILAIDNQACGGLNARFQGIWRRASP